MQTVLLISGAHTGKRSFGKYNTSLFQVAHEYLSKSFDVTTTIVEKGYDVKEEISKWEKADFIIYQYPIYWFMMPPALKQYLDEVYLYGKFFEGSDDSGVYGSGGLMKGKKIMLSTTWNLPENAFGSEFFEGLSRDKVLLPMRITQTFCGMDELPHFSCHDVVKNPKFEEDKIRYLDHLKKTFEMS